MNPLLGEFIGTTLVVLLGNGVVANVILNKTKGNGGGLIVITVGWAMAVFVGVFTVAASSGAHLNPAVTVALAVAGKFPWANVPGYVLMQMLGGMTGAFLVWLIYRNHLEQTADGDTKLAVFCTGPAIRNTFSNLTSEVIGTFVLVYGVLSMASPKFGLGALNALPVALLVMSIGVSLGGTTGYAINPARDLGPRLMHAILPISGKRDSDWGYAYVPVLGSILGGVLAAVLYSLG
ncbi:MIP/aquaporin family protein [Glaciimonas soli]|uniref:MIP family channel protein n=1 Tax=Glaciimonas soli TaxID=2590999 RepID=A0A843YXW6_9BURK|nr:MIP/aquaporin family protein [Glaciimonas soli]MQR01386.1 MIP family channel protein [Glaciimonas soli]